MLPNMVFLLFLSLSIILLVPLLCVVLNQNVNDVQQLSPRLISQRGQSGIFNSPELQHIPLNLHLFLEMSISMNRVCNPCRVVAQAPASGCGEFRKDYRSLKVFALTAVLCDFVLERSPGPFPPPPAVIGSVSNHLHASLIYYFSFSPTCSPILPFISIFYNDLVSFFCSDS